MQTSRVRTAATLALGMSALTLTVAGCGSGSAVQAAATASRAGSSAAVPTAPTAPTGSPTPTPTPSSTPTPTGPVGASAGGSLASYVVPAPAGYHVSTDSDADTGPIATSDFDQQVGTGAARRLGFSSGFSMTYDQDSGDNSYEYDLFRFTTGAGAAAFLTAVVPTLLDDPAQKPVRGLVAGLPGAVAVSPTLTSHAEGDDFGVAARRDRVVVLVDLNTDAALRTYRAVVAAAAVRQYARLVPTATT